MFHMEKSLIPATKIIKGQKALESQRQAENGLSPAWDPFFGFSGVSGLKGFLLDPQAVSALRVPDAEKRRDPAGSPMAPKTRKISCHFRRRKEERKPVKRWPKAKPSPAPMPVIPKAQPFFRERAG